MKNDLNYEEDVEIDPDNLDVETLRQAGLFFKYSKNEADAKREHALSWENVKMTRARLVLEASEDKSIKNTTQLEAYYRDHPEHQKAKQDLIEAEYEMNIASAARFAIGQRKDMIENLTKLMIANYIAKPLEPRNLSQEAESYREKRTEDVRNRASEKLSRTRNRN